MNDINIRKYLRRIEQEVRALRQSVRNGDKPSALEAFNYLKINVNMIEQELK